MNESRYAYLACWKQGIKLAIGRPVRHKDRLVGFSYGITDPTGIHSRRVFFQVLNQVLDKGEIERMSLHLDPSPELDQLREIRGSGQADSVSFETYRSGHPVEWLSYFIGTEQYGDRCVPPLLRRRDLAGEIDTNSPRPLLNDQIFNGQRWIYTWRLWDVGTARDGYDDYAEISEGAALRLVLMRLARQLSISDPR